MKNHHLLLIATILSTAISCQKSQDGPNNSATFSITSISPTHGAAGTDIRVLGIGFPTNLANDTVKINGSLAIVTSATDTALTVTIPVQAGTGKVTLTAGGKTATGPVLTYDSSWIVSTVAGSSKGYVDATGTSAQFSKPYGVCVDKNGNIYVADMGNSRIRKITKDGVVSTLAGSTYGTTNGIGTAAQFETPTSVAVDDNGRLYITDQNANQIRKYDPTSGAVTTLAGIGSSGNANGPVAYATLYEPSGISVSADGNYVYFCDIGNNNIRIVDGGVVSTMAGNTCYSGHTDGLNRVATFQSPSGLTVDASGNVYVADTYSQAIRMVSISTWLVSTIAGDTVRQGSKDGVGRAAQFFAPASICMAANGTLYVADTYNHEIRQVTQAGVVTTIAGSTTSGFADGPGVSARFNTPWGINIGADGALYVADTYNNKVRKLVRQ